MQTRMVRSIEGYVTLARAWPACSRGSGDSVSCKSPGARRPFGRDLRMSWRFVVLMVVLVVKNGTLKSCGHPERMCLGGSHPGSENLLERFYAVCDLFRLISPAF